MNIHPNELIIYFDPSSNMGKQTRAIAQTISNNINLIDYHKQPLTTTLWKDIINMLDLKPKDLLDKSRKDYQEKIAGNTFTMSGWLEVLMNNPQMIKAPIAIFQNKAILCKKPTDLLQFDRKSRTSVKVPPHLRAHAH